MVNSGGCYANPPTWVPFERGCATSPKVRLMSHGRNAPLRGTQCAPRGNPFLWFLGAEPKDGVVCVLVGGLVECFARVLPARRATDCSQLRGRRRAGSGYPGGFLNPCANLENRATNKAARSGDAGHAVTLDVLARVS